MPLAIDHHDIPLDVPGDHRPPIISKDDSALRSARPEPTAREWPDHETDLHLLAIRSTDESESAIFIASVLVLEDLAKCTVAAISHVPYAYSIAVGTMEVLETRILSSESRSKSVAEANAEFAEIKNEFKDILETLIERGHPWEDE